MLTEASMHVFERIKKQISPVQTHLVISAVFGYYTEPKVDFMWGCHVTSKLHSAAGRTSSTFPLYHFYI